MGYERETYYYDADGGMSWEQNEASVVRVNSVEHDVYGNPSFTAVVLDLEGAIAALPILNRKCSGRESSAISDAIRRAERASSDDPT